MPHIDMVGYLREGWVEGLLVLVLREILHHAAGGVEGVGDEFEEAWGEEVSEVGGTGSWGEEAGNEGLVSGV